MKAWIERTPRNAWLVIVAIGAVVCGWLSGMVSGWSVLPVVSMVLALALLVALVVILRKGKL